LAGRAKVPAMASQDHHFDWRLPAAVALGGGIGASLRHGFNLAFPTIEGTFPLTTFAENAVGAFALGLVMVLIIERFQTPRYLQPMLCTGVLGSFTTFSNLSLQAVKLADGGQWALAIGYVWGSIGAGLLAALAGMLLARRIARRPAEVQP
ncbi:MAG: CrcB family protein, partial [Phycisphaeraceae bacterium]